jgi:hypothetical protein
VLPANKTSSLHVARMADNTYRIRKVRKITSGPHAGREYVESEAHSSPGKLGVNAQGCMATWFQ